jgi:hypothetical protein
VGYLGSYQATGALDPNNPYVAGAWTVKFDPSKIGIRDATFEVYHITVLGPDGSSFRVFIDTTFYDNVQIGDLNSWDPAQPMHVEKGRTIFFYYNVATGAAPTITIFCRQPSPI